MVLQINISSLIPNRLRDQAIDALADFLAEQAKKYASDELAAKISGLRSDAAFIKEFEAGLDRAAKRFVDEYEVLDEDLVAAIAANEDFFKNEEVQKALLTILKRPGTYLTSEREAVIKSFATVLPSRKNRERVDRAVAYLLRCLAEELWHLPELQPIYSLQIQRITAESAREQLAMQKTQLQVLTNLDAGIRETLLQLTSAIAEKKLLTASGTPDSTSIQPKHNLPRPSHGRFVGRQAELAQVARLLRPYPHSREHLVTIDGISGIGKTTLALEVAYRFVWNYARIPREERFEAIVWTSAKPSVLTAEGIVTRYYVSRTLDDIYAAIATVLGLRDIIRMRQEERATAVLNVLSRQRVLIVVDNLETVADEAVMGFLRELPAPTKAIVTTRHRIDVAYPVRLTSMSWKDSRDLIVRECEKKMVKMSEDEIRLLHERTGGIPLAIVWSISQMSFGYGVEAALTRLGQPNSDIIRFCFEGAIEQISGKPAYKVMLALSFFASDASRAALGYITNLAKIDVDDGLIQLSKLLLITENEKGRFEMSPLVIQLALNRLDVAATKEYETKYVSYYRQLANGVTESDYWGGVKNFPDLKAVSNEMVNIARAVELSFDLELWDATIDLCYVSVHYYAFAGSLAERLFVVEKAIEAAEHINDDEALAWLLVDAIEWVLRRQGDIGAAKAHVSRGKGVAERSNMWDCVALAKSYLARIAAIEGNLSDAAKLASESVPMAKSPFVLARVHLIGGYIAFSQKNFEQAIPHFEEVLKVATTTSDIYEEAQAQIYIGYCHLYLKNYEASQEAFSSALERSLSGGSIVHVAEAKRGLAALYYELGDEGNARKCAQESNAIREALGIHIEEGF